MRSRAFRPIAVLLGILLLTNTPAHAGPVTIGDVLQIIGSYQNPPSLRLRGISQTTSTHVAAGVTASTSADNVDSSVTSNSLLTGIESSTQDPQKTVTIAAQGDVEITVCDCGVVTAGAGFPKWPLLFLAAIPLFFIKDKDGEEIIPNPTPTPTPTTTPETPVPEPASLLLFGSGLAAVGASLRRRRMKAKLMLQSETTEEG